MRIYYMTQAKTAPPTFLIFTNQKEPLHFSYQRFLENELRAKFDFVGTPVRFIQRMRKRDKKGPQTATMGCPPPNRKQKWPEPQPLHNWKRIFTASAKSAA